MTQLKKIINPLNDVRNDLETFFGVLRRFNGNHPVDQKLRTRIENYFEFRWDKDVTQALKT
jgi:hypothetical protein